MLFCVLLKRLIQPKKRLIRNKFKSNQLAIPKLMSGLGTSVKKCPN